MAVGFGEGNTAEGVAIQMPGLAVALCPPWALQTCEAVFLVSA